MTAAERARRRGMLVGLLDAGGGTAAYAYDPGSARIFLAADEDAAAVQAAQATAGPGARPDVRPDDSGSAVAEPGMPAWSLAVHLNHACNLACVYCYADGRTSDGSGEAPGAYGGDRSYLPQETLVAGVRAFFRDAGDAPANINFLGGEPLLSQSRFVRAVQLVRAEADASGTAVRFEVTTNGTRLSPPIVDVLREHRFEVSVSVDGDPATHDAQRPLLSGRGSHDKVAAGLERLQAAGIRYSVRMTALRSRSASGFAADHLALLRTGASSAGAQFSTYAEDGRRPMAPEEEAALLRHYEAVALGVAAGDDAARRIAAVAKVVTALVSRSRRDHQCGAGRRYFALTPSGDVFPCHRFAGMSHYALGNVADDGFRFAPVDLFVRRGLGLRPATADRSGCRSCFARNVCAGGCPQLAAPGGGDLDAMPPFYCQEMRLRVHAAVRGLVRHALGDERPWRELG